MYYVHLGEKNEDSAFSSVQIVLILSGMALSIYCMFNTVVPQRLDKYELQH